MQRFRAHIAVYMLASRRYGTLYVGVTSDLIWRVRRHRAGELPGFTRTYDVKRLVWWETHETMRSAIRRERSLKKYPREWKINLVEIENPEWRDLFEGLVSLTESSPEGF